MVVVDADGQVAWSRGDAHRSVLPRSALKPVQAVPLVRSDNSDAQTDERIAIASASHGGELDHVAAVDAWLSDLGVGAEALECGAHPPVHRPSADQMVVAAEPYTERHNTCSGKHVGFLSLCLDRGFDPVGYVIPGHPLQADLVTPAIEEFCGHSLAGTSPGVDGCGIPVWAMPLDRLANGWASLRHAVEGRRILGAMVAAPFMVGGSGRLCTRMISEGQGRVVVKTGAEGVYCGIDMTTGMAVALKARDGATRASEAAIEWTMAELGAIDRPQVKRLWNSAGTDIGSIRVAA